MHVISSKPVGFPTSNFRLTPHRIGLHSGQNHWEFFQKAHMQPQPPAASLAAFSDIFKKSGLSNEDLDCLDETSKTIEQHPNKERRYETFVDQSFQEQSLQGVDFTGSRFSHKTDFSHTKGAETNFSNCILPEVNFQHSALKGPNFSSASMNYANFNHFNPEKPTVGFTTLVGLFAYSLGVVHGKPPCFKEAQLMGASFKHANLRHANFENANLTHATFEHADLQGANLVGARILGADFRGAKLQGAKINLAATVKNEQAVTGNAHIAQTVLELAELSVNHGLDLGLNDPDALHHIKQIFQAKEKGLITQLELKEAFSRYYKEADRLGLHQDLTPEESLIYAFKRLDHNNFDDLHTNSSRNQSSNTSSFEFIDG